MRPMSQQMAMLFPALLALLLCLVSMAPLTLGAKSYAPNIAWLMTLVMVAHYPPIWPRGLAFALGLLQDLLFMTPLGAQALLALMIAQWALLQRGVHKTQRFRLRWLEASLVLLFAHVGLWFLMQLAGEGASIGLLVRGAIINALWYPLIYALGSWLVAALPEPD